MQKGDNKKTTASLLSLLALAFTAYMVINSATTPKPAWASTYTGREYPAPTPTELQRMLDEARNKELERVARQLKFEVDRTVLRHRAEKRRQMEKWLQSLPPVPKDFPETEAMEALLLAEDYSGVHWEVLDATHKQETRGGRFLGRYRYWQVMNAGQSAAFLKICQATGRDPKKQVCSSEGAIGQMQFMPKTWLAEGKDGNGDGIKDPWNPEDAIPSAAHFLARQGYASDPDKAIAYYNGGTNRGPEVKKYVAEVKAKAAKTGRQYPPS